MNTRQLLSVGIDIGTTTTQVIFSRLELVNRAAVSQVPRYEFIKREISWQSPVFFTPVDKQGGLKEAELKTLILEQYQAAGIAPESVDSGAIIITGESAKTRNARPAVAPRTMPYSMPEKSAALPASMSAVACWKPTVRDAWCTPINRGR